MLALIESDFGTSILTLPGRSSQNRDVVAVVFSLEGSIVTF